ncbi:hypothetical protein HF984_10510 [Rothia terrae]|uniref:hypothetical protein n=1 Tax=Rothia terrae TaxID=396015 RepID=UPI0014487C19|nr:hypothetical protein [Rothia terrae]
MWVSIAACHIVFCKRYLAEGNRLEDLKYRAPGYPYLSWVTLIVCALSCVLIVFDPTQRPALFYTVPFVALCYLASWIMRQRFSQTGK